MVNLTAADMMTRTEAALSPDVDIYRALRQLLKRKLTGAPVVPPVPIICETTSLVRLV